MNTSVTLQPSAINNNKQMEQNYKLALKHFINKNFPVSFTLISDLFQNAFGEFIKGTISRNLLVKIINLYLLETGVCLKEETGHLGQVQSTAALNAITSNEVSNRIRGVFGNRVPCEVLYNLHLMYVTNKEVLIADKDDYLNQLRIDYSRVDDGDKYREKFMELVVFEILPTFDEFGEAEMLISDPTKLTKLAEIKKAKQDAQDKERFKALERERAAKERKEKEMALAKEKARQSSLKYKSIKEIQKNYNEESVRKPETSGSQSTNQQLKNRLLYVYGIVQKYLKENILILLIVAVLAFGSRKYLKGVNLKDKIIETVQMAFKFSYV